MSLSTSPSGRTTTALPIAPSQRARPSVTRTSQLATDMTLHWIAAVPIGRSHARIAAWRFRHLRSEIFKRLVEAIQRVDRRVELFAPLRKGDPGLGGLDVADGFRQSVLLRRGRGRSRFETL